jgi:polyisoprenyl-phosphate glycosyltransferase
MKTSNTLLAIVPLFNEGPGLTEFHASLCSQEQKIAPWGWSLKILYIDDGSTDTTPEVLNDLAHCDPRVRFLRLSRNFGHQAALCAGIEAATPNADAVVLLDGDGQHPVELIPEMLRLHLSGIDIVRTARIDDRNAGTLLKRWISVRFHDLWGQLSETKMPNGVTEFALFGSVVLRALQQFHESHRYLRGLLTLVGFTTFTLPIRMLPRAHGSTKYSLSKQLRLASDGIFSFSTLPLKLCLLPGLVFVCAATVETVAMIWRFATGRPIADGWTSLMVILLLGFGCTMLLLAVAGLYIGKIFEQVKDRPVYVVRSDSMQSHDVIQPISNLKADSNIGDSENAVFRES